MLSSLIRSSWACNTRRRLATFEFQPLTAKPLLVSTRPAKPSRVEAILKASSLLALSGDQNFGMVM